MAVRNLAAAARASCFDPLVSVLVPVRDAAGHLGPCLASLRRQTLTHHEVVAVDDGSTDGSSRILDEASRCDPRLRVLQLPRLGLVEALNRGLELCRGRLVARMDADDISHPRRLEQQTDVLDRLPDVGVVASLVRHFPRRGLGHGTLLYEAWLNGLGDHHQMWRERFVECPVAHPSVVVRRELLVEAGGYRDMGWPEDYDLWLRLFERGVIFAKVPHALVFVREHPERLTRRDARYQVREFLRAKAHFLLRGPLAGGRQAVVWGAGKTGRRLAAHLVRGGGSVVAFVDIDPRIIGRHAAGVPIFGVEEIDQLRRSGPVLAAVASRGARQLIRARLEKIGLVEGEGFWCVA